MPNNQSELANADDLVAIARNLLTQASEDLEQISPERLPYLLEDKVRAIPSHLDTYEYSTVEHVTGSSSSTPLR